MEDVKFRASTIKALLDISLTNKNGGKRVKITQGAIDLVSEYLRCVVVEAAERASVAGDSRAVDETHLEKVLPQLLLDIS